MAEVIAVAKRALKPGDRLDDFGGFTFYGIMDRARMCSLKALPAGLVPGAEVIHAVVSGEIVTWDDVKLDENSVVLVPSASLASLADERSTSVGKSTTIVPVRTINSKMWRSMVLHAGNNI